VERTEKERWSRCSERWRIQIEKLMAESAEV
jgi:hypothetical protein